MQFHAFIRRIVDIVMQHAIRQRKLEIPYSKSRGRHRNPAKSCPCAGTSHTASRAL